VTSLSEAISNALNAVAADLASFELSRNEAQERVEHFNSMIAQARAELDRLEATHRAYHETNNVTVTLRA
jgi:septal ring factor EnvC (AmiA/AmiB activator)